MGEKAASFRKKIKFKYYVNFLITLFALLITSSMYLFGEKNLLFTSSLVKIIYSIILAVSLNMVVGFLGELSLGHAGFMCIGAYIGGYAYNAFCGTMSQWFAIILAMLIGGVVASLFGMLIGLPALRLKGDYLAIVTLAFGEIVRSIMKNLPWFGGAQGMMVPRFDGPLFILSFVVLFFVLLILQNIMRSKHGRAVTAIRDSEVAARSCGINVTYYKIMIFTISAFFAGVAGVLYAADTTIVTYGQFSYNYSIEILVMVVLGGMGNTTGNIISASVLTFINIKLTSMGGDFASIKYLIYALILITVMILNSSPKLKPFKEKYNIHTFGIWIGRKILSIFVKKEKTPVEGISDSNEGVSWEVVPTKVDMDSTLLKVDLHKKEDSFNEDTEDKNE